MKKRLGIVLLMTILILACNAGWAGADVGGSPGEGDVLAFGDHRDGQLGIGDPLFNTIPREIDNIGVITAVASGEGHSLLLTQTGEVYSFGQNYYGQLGLGSSGDGTHSFVPQKIPGISGAIAIAAGGFHSLILLDNGEVWAFGYNAYGQLGLGHTTDRNTPYQLDLQLGSPVVDIAAGYGHSLLLLANGEVYSFGCNLHGQLGLGDNSDRHSPSKITGIGEVDAVAAGTNHSLLLINGEVYSCGGNWNGELGLGDQTARNIPTLITGLSNATDIAAGSSTSMVSLANGDLYSFGNNVCGQLGLGLYSDNNTSPQLVSALNGIQAMSLGSGHSLIVLQNGEVYSCGANVHGQLGQGDTAYRNLPVRLDIVTGAVEAATGEKHSLILLADGRVLSFGFNELGELGLGDPKINNTPALLSGPENIKDVAAGANHTLLLQESGLVYSCGQGYYGQLGQGNNLPLYEPTLIAGISGAKQVAAGDQHSLVLLENGDVYSFGDNYYGQLGHGNQTSQSSPCKIPDIGRVKAIAAGSYHSLLLMENGDVYSFGDNVCGQLGHGHLNQLNLPTKINLISPARAIAAGGRSSMILLENGDVYSFGDNNSGQLGHGHNENKTLPMKIKTISGAQAIAMSQLHTLILLQNGDLYSCGFNDQGQLGQGDYLTRSTPAKVEGLSGVQAIAAGNIHSLALVLASGEVYSFGSNEQGQLGLGDYISQPAPVKINAISSAKAIAAGGSHSLAIAAPQSSQVKILSLELPGQTRPAFIDYKNYTIGAEVSPETDLSNLTPYITVSTGAEITPSSETAQDFSSPLTYTVSTGEGISQEWLVTVTPAQVYNGQVIYVDADAIGANNGSSWTDAFTTLQEALDLARSGDEIWVRAGVYYPSSDYGMYWGDPNRRQHFRLKNGVSILGGFAGGESSREARDPAQNITVLDGATDTDSLFSYHVFYHPEELGLDSSAVLDGFTISRGHADGSSITEDDHFMQGGGMYNHNCSPTLNNLIFRMNTALYGGAIYNKDSSPALNQVLFEMNEGFYGGAIYNTNSSPILSGTSFIDNQAQESGGAIHNANNSETMISLSSFQSNSSNNGGAIYNCQSNMELNEVSLQGNLSNESGAGIYGTKNSSLSLNQVDFTNNQATLSGGGMYNFESTLLMNQVSFDINSAQSSGGAIYTVSSQVQGEEVDFFHNAALTGGGIYNDESSIQLSDSSFKANTASASGAAIFNNDSSYSQVYIYNETGNLTGFAGSPLLINTIFIGNNTYSGNGGALYNNNSNPELINVDFLENQSPSHSSVMYNYNNSNPILKNCILWDNQAYNSQIRSELNSSCTISYSLVQGSGGSQSWKTNLNLGIDEGNNLDQNPNFRRSPSPGPNGLWGDSDDDYGDLRLFGFSPAVDRGDNQPYGSEGAAREILTDLAGSPRIQGTKVDMGAYETEPGLVHDISSIAECEHYLVPLGTSFYELMTFYLPHKVLVYLDGDLEQELDVVWSDLGYDNHTPGDYSLQGTIGLIPGITNSQDYQAQVIIMVDGPPNIHYVEEPCPITVPYGTPFNEIEFPFTVLAIAGDEQFYELEVSWLPGAYDPYLSTTYTITGILGEDYRVTNTDNLSAQISVLVEEEVIISLDIEFPEQVEPPVIDYETRTITVQVQDGSDLSNLAPIISASHGAGVYPGSGIAQDFSNPVIYTVTPLSGPPQEWTVIAYFIPVTGISIDQVSLTLEPGQSAQINAALSPTNATNQNIIWHSSDPQVVEVDQLGNITALGCGTSTITATSESGGFSDYCQVTVEMAGFKRELVSGWNTLSVPLKLSVEQNTLGQILDTAKVDLIYTYDPMNGQWVEEAGDLTVHPMDALYVKVKNGMKIRAEMFPYEDLSIAYEKDLPRGWNLFGPSLDLGSPEGYKILGADYLKSLDGRYSLVISQPVGSQKGWVYVQGNSNSPYLYAGSGYWVYLLEDKNLAGAGFTPVERIYQVPPEPDSIQPQSDSSDTVIPELPAAFFGSVKYANGEPVQSGTIEIVIDGQVRATKEFSGGYYGLSLGERLIVEKMYLDYAQNIKFMVNGQEVSYQEVFDPTTASGKLIELHLTIDNTLPADLYYLSLAVTAPDVVELIFSQNISNNLATEEALKNAISFSPDGLEFNPLSDQDTIQIVEQRLIIGFAQALEGNNNVIKINAQALKDLAGRPLDQEVVSSPFASQPVDECFIATAAFGSKFDWPVALLRQFRDQCLLSNQLGSKLVNYYYQKSPAIAAIIKDHSMLKLAVRIILIPFIGAAYLAVHYQWALLLMILILISLPIFRLFRISRI